MKLPRRYTWKDKDVVVVTGSSVTRNGKVVQLPNHIWWVGWYPPNYYLGVGGNNLLYVYDDINQMTSFHDTVCYLNRYYTVLLDHLYMHEEYLYVEAICSGSIMVLRGELQNGQPSIWEPYAKGRMIIPIDRGPIFVYYDNTLHTINLSYTLYKCQRMDAHRLYSPIDTYVVSHRSGLIVVPIDITGNVVLSDINDYTIELATDIGELVIYTAEYISVRLQDDQIHTAIPVIECPMSKQGIPEYTERKSAGAHIYNGTLTIFTGVGHLQKKVSTMSPYIYKLSYSFEYGYLLFTSRRFEDNSQGLTVYRVTLANKIELLEILHQKGQIAGLTVYMGTWICKDVQSKYTIGVESKIIRTGFVGQPDYSIETITPVVHSISRH